VRNITRTLSLYTCATEVFVFQKFDRELDKLCAEVHWR